MGNYMFRRSLFHCFFLFTRHHVRLVFSKRKIKFGVRPNDKTHLLSKVIFMFTGILYLMTKFWNFQGLKNVINHNTSNLLKRSCGPHGHLSGLRTNLKLGVKSRKSFWHFKNLSWRFSTTLSTSNKKTS